MSSAKEWWIEPEETSEKRKDLERNGNSVYIEDDEEFKRIKIKKSTSLCSSTVDSQENKSTTASSSASDNNTDTQTRTSASKNWRNYTVSELIDSIENDNLAEPLPPALERRVRDFKFAQSKRETTN